LNPVGVVVLAAVIQWKRTGEDVMRSGDILIEFEEKLPKLAKKETDTIV
jgi:hypothetical protein